MHAPPVSALSILFQPFVPRSFLNQKMRVTAIAN